MKNQNFKRFFSMSDSKIVAAGAGIGYLFTASKVFAARTWPWTGILNDIKDELTGPLPLTLGALGLVIAAVGLFTGQASGFIKSFLMIILAISVALFAPTLVEWIADSANY